LWCSTKNGVPGSFATSGQDAHLICPTAPKVAIAAKSEFSALSNRDGAVSCSVAQAPEQVGRHRCRQCRGKLSTPTEIPQRAFCTRFCFDSFYRHRCRVCEEPIRRRAEHQKVCIRRECKNELRRYPHLYQLPKRGQGSQNVATPLRSADKTGLKTRHDATPCLPRGLRHWHWGHLDDHDWRLINGKGHDVARVRQEGDCYWVTYPRAIPEPPLEGLEAACRRAVSLALARIEPLIVRQPGPHPLGRPSNIGPVTFQQTDWQPAGDGAGSSDHAE
jgi:hypothetical protein